MKEPLLQQSTAALFLGDLNETPKGRDLFAAFRKAGFGPVKLHTSDYAPTFFDGRTLDYILLDKPSYDRMSPEITVYRPSLPEVEYVARYSDHFPVIVDLQLAD